MIGGEHLHVLTFGRQSNNDFNVVVSGEDTWRKPTAKVERVSVPGRNGELVISSGAYENVSITYHCGITSDFDAYYAELVNYLMSLNGYQRLEDSYHPDFYRMAAFESIGDPALIKGYQAGQFDITFNCKPQMFLKIGETAKEYNYSANTQYIMNPTLHDAKPLLRVWGTGSFTIGHDTVTITQCDTYTDLDCELEDAFKGATNCNGYVQLSGDHFPVIPGGRQGISFGANTITKIRIIPRWWQL